MPTSESPRLKKDWEPTAEAFEKLLLFLDPDPAVAATKYETVRTKLIKLFKWRNCVPEEEYADITINRVTRRVFENADVNVADPYSYFHGTALNVVREYWRRAEKQRFEDIDEPGRDLPAEKTIEDLMDEEAEHNAEANRYNCMRTCLEKLPEAQRRLIVEYHQGESKKEVRKGLAEKLGVTMNVLRIRACRIRETLQACVEGCIREIG